MRPDAALRQHEACGCVVLCPDHTRTCLTCWHALTSASRQDWPTPSTDVNGVVLIPRGTYFRLRGAVKEAARELAPAAPGPINLADWQESLGVTGQQVADDLGVSRQSWSRWKNGQVKEPPWLVLALETLARRYQGTARRARKS